MKKLPLGIQTFRKIIEEDFLYIDKTKDIFHLINRGQLFFLSRPRRFGKSLLVSILKEIFSGNKELFKGLYIYDKIEEVILLGVGGFKEKDIRCVMERAVLNSES